MNKDSGKGVKQELFSILDQINEDCEYKSTEHLIQRLVDEVTRFNYNHQTKFEPHDTAIEYLETKQGDN